MKRLIFIAIALVALFVFLMPAVGAQDFGFGFDGDAGEAAPPGGGAFGGGAASALSVKISGDIGAELIGYAHDFSDKETAAVSSLGDIISGSLNFSASGANVDALVGLNLSLAGFSEIGLGMDSPAATPLLLNEAYLRGFFGPVNIEAGYRKLTWGKADSFGPLDVINPVDYTDLTNISDIQGIKIARPMIHLALNTGSFSKLEAVFIPNFTGHRFDQSGRWAPKQLSNISALATDDIIEQIMQDYPVSAADVSGIIGALIDAKIITQDLLDQISLISGMPPEMLEQILGPIIASTYPQILSGAFAGFSPAYPDTSGLEYFQAGLRFTTTIRSADFGLQYFYGNLFQPDFTIGSVDAFVNDLLEGNANLDISNPYAGDLDLLYKIKYSRYHQIGIDYAQVLAGFNVRSEFALFLTEDLKGDDGSVRNPFLGWSLGFDRDLFWGINANVQCNETIRLMNDKVGNDPLLDCEAGTKMTGTRITMQLSKRFLKDELETKVVAIWDVENSDCYIIPAVVWNIKDLTAELASGIFMGKNSGDLGQYWKNTYVKMGLTYSF